MVICVRATWSKDLNEAELLIMNKRLTSDSVLSEVPGIVLKRLSLIKFIKLTVLILMCIKLESYGVLHRNRTRKSLYGKALTIKCLFRKKTFYVLLGKHVME